MKTFTIPKKICRNIYDIASDLEDRIIKFRKNSNYAVVPHYNYGKYTCHKNEQLAVEASKKCKVFNVIIDTNGVNYEIDFNGKLQQTSN